MSERWARFYNAAGTDAHETLVLAAERFASERSPSELRAVDLGCGAGRDTAELLRRGWTVLAIDAQEEAVRRLRERGDIPPAALARLTAQVAPFEEAAWPPVDLVNAGFSLPFCPPAAFPDVWRRVRESLLTGGRFSGHLFGERDGWAADGEMTFHTRAEAEKLFRGLELERFDEVERDGATVTGEPKHWHVFHVVARRR